MKTKISITVSPKTFALARTARDLGLINCIEIVPDAFLNSWKGFEDLDRIIRFFDIPHSFHFTTHSLCSTDFNQVKKLERTRNLIKEFPPLLVSDHLSCSFQDDIDLESNIGTIYNKTSVELTASNIKTFLRETRTQKANFLIEHIPNYYQFNESTMSPEEFCLAVLKKSGCGLLLDLHNLYVDEINRKVDAIDIIQSIPPNEVKEIHLAGGHWSGNAYLDTHDQDLPKRVLELLEVALDRFQPKIINLEREANFHQLETVLEDLERVRNVCAN